MFSKLRSAIGSVLVSALGVSIFAPSALAVNINTTECLNATYTELAHVQRVYRSVIFGQEKAEDAKKGSVRFDKAGNAWMKVGTNRWQTLQEGMESKAKSDGLMDQDADTQPRRGWMFTRKAPSSDLLPPIIQAFRAYECRLQAVCMAAEQSQGADESATTIDVQPEGCINFTEPVLNACKQNSQLTAGANTCQNVVDGMIAQEMDMLMLLVSYDSAYRTLLQFEGVFEGFLTDFRFPLIEPLWQTVRAMGGLANLPCLISQCDE